jgi:hypothetical protein
MEGKSHWQLEVCEGLQKWQLTAGANDWREDGKVKVKVKVKQSRNRPGVAQSVPGGLGSQISWHSAREGGEVVILTHRPPLPPGVFLVLIFPMGWVDPRDMERSEGDMSLKNPVTTPRIDPGTFRLVAQRLNHYATPGPVEKMAKWLGAIRSWELCRKLLNSAAATIIFVSRAGQNRERSQQLYHPLYIHVTVHRNSFLFE